FDATKKLRESSQGHGKADNGLDSSRVSHISQTRFGKTIVQGALTYPFERVMRDLQYEPEMAWSQQAIKKTCLQFKKRAVFDEIYVPPDKKKIQDTTDVLVRLRHDDPCE